MPQLEIVINGGIVSLGAIEQHLQHVDGVMLGRAAYHDPWLLARCQQKLLGSEGPTDREAVVSEFSRYLGRKVEQGVPVKHMTRHVLGLFQGQPGAKRWRRFLSENAHQDDRNVVILKQALQEMRRVGAA